MAGTGIEDRWRKQTTARFLNYGTRPARSLRKIQILSHKCWSKWHKTPPCLHLQTLAKSYSWSSCRFYHAHYDQTFSKMVIVFEWLHFKMSIRFSRSVKMAQGWVAPDSKSWSIQKSKDYVSLHVYTNHSLYKRKENFVYLIRKHVHLPEILTINGF